MTTVVEAAGSERTWDFLLAKHELLQGEHRRRNPRQWEPGLVDFSDNQGAFFTKTLNFCGPLSSLISKMKHLI